jgi:hypothetical protein
MFMGNRGILHDDAGKLAAARWRHPHWIICLTSFKSRHREVMTPGKYTELFFSDEAAALAAGHRPCAECRREAYNDFRRAWQIGHGMEGGIKAAGIDGILHQQRVNSRSRAQITWREKLSSLPDGTFFSAVDAPDVAVLIHDQRIWKWAFSGYREIGEINRTRNPHEVVDVRTPGSIVGALGAGYKPVLHESLSLEI